jgi:hypothetical protein
MKNNLIVLIGLLISFCSFGQESQYFSMYFQTKVKERTPYLRTYKKNDNKFLTEDFKNDTLQLSGMITGTNEISEVDNFLMYVRTDGQKNLYKDSFKKLNGEFIAYYGNGKPSSQVIYKQNKILHTQVWTADGKEQLINGAGIYKCFSDDSNVDVYQEYEDSVLVSGYSFRRLKGDTLYSKVDKQAEPKEGIQDFYQNLAKVLKYPIVARFVGKEGRVFVEFIVDETGKLTEFNPKTKEGYKFETKVIKELSKFPNWNPAVYKGRFVKQMFVLPINYKLTN